MWNNVEVVNCFDALGMHQSIHEGSNYKFNEKESNLCSKNCGFYQKLEVPRSVCFESMRFHSLHEIFGRLSNLNNSACIHCIDLNIYSNHSVFMWRKTVRQTVHLGSVNDYFWNDLVSNELMCGYAHCHAQVYSVCKGEAEISHDL